MMIIYSIDSFMNGTKVSNDYIYIYARTIKLNSRHRKVYTRIVTDYNIMME